MAVVADMALPCCAILGANFLSENGAIVDCYKGEMHVVNGNEELIYPLLVSKSVSIFTRGKATAFVGSNRVSDESREEDSLKVRLTLNRTGW